VPSACLLLRRARIRTLRTDQLLVARHWKEISQPHGKTPIAENADVFTIANVDNNYSGQRDLVTSVFPALGAFPGIGGQGIAAGRDRYLLRPR
jgi:hypothetical protein